MGWLVGTRNGLFGPGGDHWLDGREITALAPAADGWWALVDGRDVVRLNAGAVEMIASIDEELGRSLLPVGDEVLIGTAKARMALARPGSAEMLTTFDRAPGRERWYTPWGGPPDTRSLSAAPDGAVYANVHVGGILRASDPLGAWEPTIDIDADVHVGEQSAVGSSGERPRVGGSSPRRVPAVAPLGAVERREHLDRPRTREGQPSVRRADQHAAGRREQTPADLLVDRCDRLHCAAVESNNVAAVRQRPPPIRVGHQRRDLATVEPVVSTLPEQPVPRADEPSHEP